METGAVLSPADIYCFGPNAERVGFLARRMRSQLRESLLYLAEQLEAHIPVSPARLASFVGQLDGGPLPPEAYAIYSDLVFAIDQDDLTDAARLLDLLLAVRPLTGGLQVWELGQGPARDRSERYVRYALYGSGLSINLAPPLPRAAVECRREIQAALALLETEDPQSSEEMRELVREIILCRNGSSRRGAGFDGASNFMLWGAIFINADQRRDRPTMIQALAHESAHHLLFALCPDEPLVHNDPAARYRSPLREDLRPMEGIYHATFVVARMHRALRQLAPSPNLIPREKAALKTALESNSHAFWQGMMTLDQQAEFSEPGRAIIEGARAYMHSVN